MNETSGGDAADNEPTLGEHGPELVVAALLMVFAIGVLLDSMRVGIGWASDGPRSGYFPFYIGLLLLAASATTFVRTLLQWRRPNPVFATRSALASVISVLVPIVVYVVAISFLGIYVASALLIVYFMRRHGHFGWLFSLTVSIGVPLVFFIVFERWFLVPLAKGPLERVLGF